MVLDDTFDMGSIPSSPPGKDFCKYMRHIKTIIVGGGPSGSICGYLLKKKVKIV